MTEPPRQTVTLVRTSNLGEAELIRQLLRTYDIPSRVLARMSHSLFPIAVGEMAVSEVLVRAQDVDEARGLLADHRRNGLRIVRGGL